MVRNFIKGYGLYMIWGVAFLGMLGSLYFSEVKGYAPCVLCWFQRIALYPLVLIMPIGILRKDRNVASYAIALGIAGLAISVYHNLLYYHVLPETVSPCTVGVSCLTEYVSLFGFIDIPLLSFITFATIVVVATLYNKYEKRS